MEVLVLGVDHEIQTVDAWRSDELKQQYRDLLNHLLDERGVQFIGEEANPDYEYVGKQITQSRGLAREWRNIDMPKQVRQEVGIDQEQSNRKPEPRLGAIQSHLEDDGYYEDRRDGWHWLYPRVPSDQVREKYMLDRAIEGAGNAKSILVLCGSMHTGELAKRFAEAGHKVVLDFLHNYAWYSPV